jgi:amino acid transporter
MKRVLVGSPLPTAQHRHERLDKRTALAVFASDPLSSVAYATEEILLVLILAGTAALSYSLPIGVAIGALILIVVTSYRQTIRAYPRGGGAYIVTRDNSPRSLGDAAGHPRRPSTLRSISGASKGPPNPQGGSGTLGSPAAGFGTLQGFAS